MKKALLLILIGSSFILSSYAQENKKSFRPHTFLKINPVTLINELDIYVEQKISDKFSFEAGISGIYTDYPDYILSKKIDIGQKKPDISTEQFVDARGLGFRVGARLYLISKDLTFSRAAGTYFEPVLFYKKVFYPNITTTFNNNEYTSSGDKNVYGLQFLIGRQFKKDKFILDPFIGAGIRSKVYGYKAYHVSDNKISLNEGRLVSILPSLQIGIKIGFKLW